MDQVTWKQIKKLYTESSFNANEGSKYYGALCMESV